LQTGEYDRFAMNLANDAKSHALNENKLSPFMTNYNEEKGGFNTGGKDDDITIVTVKVL